MIRLALSQVRTGDVLARDVTNPNQPATVVLKAGSVLNDRILSALGSSGFRTLWIQDLSTFSIETLFSQERVTAIRQLTVHLRESMEKTSASLARGGGISLQVSPQEIQSLLTLLRQGSRFFIMPEEISDSRGNFLFHSVNVAVLSLLMGLVLQRSRPGQGEEGGDATESLVPLGMGALLHDMGKLRMADSVRFRDPWELSRTEIEQTQAHPVDGYELLRETLGSVVGRIPLCHHRNEDGTGFPPASADFPSSTSEGSNSHLFCRIVAVADAYDQLVTYCHYNSLEAMEEILCARRHHFDPQVLLAFQKVVPALLPGTLVTLNTGHGGVIVDFLPALPFSPPILLTQAANGDRLRPDQYKVIQLANATTSGITHYEGRNVKHLIPVNRQAGWEVLI